MIKITNDVLNLGLKVSYILGKNVVIERTNKLEELKKDLINQVLVNWNENKIKSDPILTEYQHLHQVTLGEKGEKYIASPEWLVKYILQNRRFISINDVVDCYNLISAKYLIAIGSHDLDKVGGQLKIALTSGTERFIPLGMTGQVNIPKGAYAFSDDQDILCFFESRQADKTKITAQTKNFITYLQGNAKTSDEYLNQAVQELLGLYQKYCFGTFSINGLMMMQSAKGGGI